MIEDKPGTVVVLRISQELSRMSWIRFQADVQRKFRNARVLVLVGQDVDVVTNQALSEVTAERDLYKGRWDRLIGHIQSGGGG